MALPHYTWILSSITQKISVEVRQVFITPRILHCTWFVLSKYIDDMSSVRIVVLLYILENGLFTVSFFLFQVYKQIIIFILHVYKLELSDELCTLKMRRWQFFNNDWPWNGLELKWFLHGHLFAVDGTAVIGYGAFWRAGLIN